MTLLFWKHKRTGNVISDEDFKKLHEDEHQHFTPTAEKVTRPLASESDEDEDDGFTSPFALGAAIALMDEDDSSPSSNDDSFQGFGGGDTGGGGAGADYSTSDNSSTDNGSSGDSYSSDSSGDSSSDSSGW